MLRTRRQSTLETQTVICYILPIMILKTLVQLIKSPARTTATANKHAPITNIQVKGSKIPYVTSELKAMIRQRDYLTL